MLLKHISLMFAQSYDLELHTLRNSSMTIEVAYIHPLCDEHKISDFIFVPFTKEEQPYSDQLQRIPEYKLVTDVSKWQDQLLRGHVLIEADGDVYAFDAKRIISNESPKTQVESAIQGPQIALSEDLKNSINLIRSFYPTPDLSIEEHHIGNMSQTPVSLLFDQRHVDMRVLNQVKEKLIGMKTDMVHAAGELGKLLVDKKKNLFPTILITERPDRIARSIAQGKIVILLKGSMFALIMPVTFFEFMHAVEDNYEAFWMTRFIIFIRYAALVLTITLPALYISVVSYNPELFRVQLAFSIAASRAAVPYPSFVEVFIMLFMIETLIEASIRLPRYIGSTATTVGGLILGQAAQQAGLVSSIMIIVTSVVAISNFVIPISSLSFSMRFLKYPLILLSIFFGISGVAVGVFLYIVYLAHLRSFGKPYFRVNGQLNPIEGDIGQVRKI
ncbi:spore germination protein [Paenibacillus sp. J5C_2022]|uniref:spore germination protein n=1 Tax=Paenibacillus sp. J5C2022 TaxID=2977129 RepID=UPI0021D23406|nr:spore germination protein [Paenibacillus sp. J5C2022]MCU6712457.1 spore germination protein [Paenibacillus sp. J5C2022]